MKNPASRAGSKKRSEARVCQRAVPPVLPGVVVPLGVPPPALAAPVPPVLLCVPYDVLPALPVPAVSLPVVPAPVVPAAPAPLVPPVALELLLLDPISPVCRGPLEELPGLVLLALEPVPVGVFCDLLSLS